jgi:galactose mutarotase-like enzyme
MITLENEYLKISVRQKGAEMTSFYNKENNTEHLWQAYADVWEWHAPNLFPVVGGCINNEVLINGKPYPMQRHGFARHSDFVLIESDETHVKFSLSQDENTMAAYPYKFSFQVLYDLLDRELRITYKVINYDDQSIHFAVGAHPAFNVPFFPNESMDDYFLEFEHDEPLKTHLLSSSGFFTGTTESLPQVKNRLPITKELFAKDALVFKDLTSRKVSLRSKNHSHSVYIRYPYFNYLGIWAKDGAPFVCLEPWIGCADTEGKITEFSQKEAIHTLDKGHVFEADFTIGIN